MTNRSEYFAANALAASAHEIKLAKLKAQKEWQEARKAEKANKGFFGKLFS